MTDQPDEAALKGFFSAVGCGHLSAVKDFVGRYGDQPLDKEDHRGLTALTIAAGKNRAEITRFLLDHGAAIDARDRTHSTALTVACIFGHKDVILTLLEYGAGHLDEAIEDARSASFMNVVDILQKEKEKRERSIVERKKERRRAAFGVFTEGLRKDFRSPKSPFKPLRRKP